MEPAGEKDVPLLEGAYESWAHYNPALADHAKVSGRVCQLRDGRRKVRTPDMSCGRNRSARATVASRLF